MSSESNDGPTRQGAPAAPAAGGPGAPAAGAPAAPAGGVPAAPAAGVPAAPAEDRKVYRRGTPFVIFWGWVAFAVYSIAQVAISDHNYFSVELTVGLLAVTAVVYATTLRSRVIADDDGVCVYNPFRDHRIGWGGVNAVYLGDSVELSCARTAPAAEKTIYCWALYSGRRSRMRSQLRAQRGRNWAFGSGFGVPSRAPAEAQALASQDPVQLMAAEMGRRSTDARKRGAPAAVLESRWAWLPLVYVAVPTAALLGLVLAK